MTGAASDRFVLQGLVCSALLLGAAGCSSNGFEDDDGSRAKSGLKGTFGVYSVRGVDGASETAYSLRSENVERTLVFETPPALSPETEIEVWGEEAGDTIRVSDFTTIESEPGVEREALVDAPPYPTRSIAFVRIDIGAGVNLSESQAQVAMFGTQAGNNSVKQFYRQVSYGTQDITGGVFGPRNHAMNGCSLATINNLADTLRPQIEGTFQHYFWYLGSRNRDCAWTSLAQLGRPSQPARDVWYNGSASCLTLFHMFGHNLGMQSSSSMKCGGSVFADNPAASCTHSEYGDGYDAMGGTGCHHVNAVHKVHEGWLLGCNGVEIRGSRTFRLLPLELECNGVQVLKIAMPKVRPFSNGHTTHNLAFYYLELRTKRGFDAGIEPAPTVLVHVGEDYRGRTQSGRNTWILDMNPATTAIDGLNQGQAFSDPAGGVSFTVTTLSANFATVQVSTNRTGAPLCLDGSTIVAPGPNTCSG